MRGKPTKPCQILLAVLMLGLAGWAAPTGYGRGALPARPALAYTNPVIDHGFPDPSILSDRGVFYAYATNGAGGTLPCARSTDLVHWTALPDAMPALPLWARAGRTWAPVVRAFAPGKRYVAYFTAWDRADDVQTIGAAVSASPAGP